MNSYYKAHILALDQNTVYIVGDAKSPQNNPITEKFKAYFIGMVINQKTDEIIDVECSATISLTNVFVKELMVGKNMLNNDIVQSINLRYFGASQKALTVAFKDAHKKYLQIKNNDAN